MAEKILVSPRSLSRDGHPALKKLEEKGFEIVTCSPGVQPTEEELLDKLPDCVGFLAGVEPVSEKVLASAKKLRVISRNGTGINSIDCAAAERFGIPICRTPGANSRGVAELALGLVFSLVRSIPFSDAALKQEKWERRKGIELKGRTLGLIGCGMVGRYVAEMACGIGMNVIAYDPFPAEDFSPSPDFRFASMVEVFETSDIISLHCPPPEDGAPLIDREAVSKMKTGVYLVNTARGELLDDEAVLEALENGKISGAALDAFRKEPPGEDPLVRHERVIAAPHVGAFTSESVSRAVEAAVENLLRELER